MVVGIEFVNRTKFEFDMGRLVKTAMQQEIVPFQRRIARSIFREVVKGTPVDTGNLIGNWRIGMNTVDSTVNNLKPESPGRDGGSQRSLQQLSKLKTSPNNMVINLSNNVEYVSIVNARSRWIQVGATRAFNKEKRRAKRTSRP